MFSLPEIVPMGERATLLQWQETPSPLFLRHLLQIKKLLATFFHVEIIHTYSEILIKAAISEVDCDKLLSSIKVLPQDSKNAIPSKIIHIPVCYAPSFGLDLEALAIAKATTQETIIARHIAVDYLVYFTGFLPGFPYLLGLDERLSIPRKQLPRAITPRGSVGIGGDQTGVYPQASPGGWHIIGHTPIPFFNSLKDPPTLVEAGDYIRFFSVNAEEHHEISQAVARSEYKLNITHTNE